MNRPCRYISETVQPNSSLASSSSLSDIWLGSMVDESGHTQYQVDVDYVSSDVRVIYRPATPALISDPGAAFSQEATSVGWPASDVQVVQWRASARGRARERAVWVR